MKYYIAYGSNMNKVQMGYRCQNATPVGKGILKGYTLAFRGSGVATILQDSQGEVPIVLWKITDECERALDIYEGFPRLYIKKDLMVTVKGKEYLGMVYVMNKPYEKRELAELPSKRYFDIISQGYEDFGINKKPLLDAVARTECCIYITRDIREQILLVRQNGRYNMLDIRGVLALCDELEFYELSQFLSFKENLRFYTNFILYGD